MMATSFSFMVMSLVRKHPAPEGALRPSVVRPLFMRSMVRKHPAPQGALRHRDHVLSLVGGQAIKHPAPEGALRLQERLGGHDDLGP